LKEALPAKQKSVAFLLFCNKSNLFFAKMLDFRYFNVVAFLIIIEFVVFFSCYGKLDHASWLDPHFSLKMQGAVWLEALLN